MSVKILDGYRLLRCGECIRDGDLVSYANPSLPSLLALRESWTSAELSVGSMVDGDDGRIFIPSYGGRIFAARKIEESPKKTIHSREIPDGYRLLTKGEVVTTDDLVRGYPDGWVWVPAFPMTIGRTVELEGGRVQLFSDSIVLAARKIETPAPKVALPPVPEGYRPLRAGEIVQRDDLIISMGPFEPPCIGMWSTPFLTRGCSVKTDEGELTEGGAAFRACRKIETPAPKAWGTKWTLADHCAMDPPPISKDKGTMPKAKHPAIPEGYRPLRLGETVQEDDLVLSVDQWETPIVGEWSKAYGTIGLSVLTRDGRVAYPGWRFRTCRKIDNTKDIDK
jgi:hypothetical protein